MKKKVGKKGEVNKEKVSKVTGYLHFPDDGYQIHRAMLEMTPMSSFDGEVYGISPSRLDEFLISLEDEDYDEGSLWLLELPSMKVLRFRKTTKYELIT